MMSSLPSCPLSNVVSRWTRRKEARPGEILCAALELFVERGFATTKMADIACAAGVTPGTLYRYFDSKEAILKAVITEGFDRAFNEADETMAQFKGNAREMLAQVILKWWQMVGETKLSGLPKLMIAEAANFPELAAFHRKTVIERGERYLQKAIEYGQQTGEFRQMDINIAIGIVCSPILMAMIWTHAPLACRAAPADTELYLQEVIQTLTQGLAASPKP